MNFTWYQGHYFRLMVWCIKTDKSAIAEEIWKLCSLENESNDDPVTDATRVIVFNGMAMVNHISIKKSKLNMCHDFAESFSKIILLHARRCEEIRVIFGRYDENSLKLQTRCSQTTGIAPAQYTITDTTQIIHLDIREFLASIETKNELTEFLSQKLSVALTHLSIKYAISYRNRSNIPDLGKDLMTYGHEEPDTGIVLHAINISTRNPFTDLSIVCDNRDALLILLHYFREIYPFLPISLFNITLWSFRKRCLWSTPWIWRFVIRLGSSWQTFLSSILSRLSRI